MMRTRKRFGQHFLEPQWADKVIRAMAPSPEDVFLEIGPGPGILTLKLAPVVAQLLAIEIDRDLLAGLAPRVPPNTTLVAGDVLDIDFDAALRSANVAGPIRLAGNLPYNISSPILFRLLDLESRRPVKDATLMLQREVADRIFARPGTHEYGVLSVLIQWRADVTRLLTIPPGAFRPPPEVRSALIRLAFRPPAFQLKDAALFEQMVRGMFTQRRKTLGNALAPFASGMGADAGEVLEEAGIDPRRRPETLEVVEIARLADLFAAAKM
jgi:16S rRNA (adenine1518-N6/adenine1519-N6)-dimethyltransferase